MIVHSCFQIFLEIQDSDIRLSLEYIIIIIIYKFNVCLKTGIVIRSTEEIIKETEILVSSRFCVLMSFALFI